jgi:hypothetical protein
MRHSELKLVSDTDDTAPVDLAEVLLASSKDLPVLRVVPSDGEDDLPDDAA